jgi:hypothetical protein
MCVVCSRSRRRRFSRHEVYNREDPTDCLHLVSKGRFAVRVLGDEHQRGTVELGRGRTIILDAEEIARRAR